MQKIGIYTLQSRNYGNRLQNYATDQVLKKMGYDPVNIKGMTTKQYCQCLCGIYRVPKCAWMFVAFLTKILKLKKSFARGCERFNRLMSYSDDYINKDGYNMGHYDAIIVGSDQVWNTTFPIITENSFLPFSHPRKIAFSASFGVDDIPYNQKIVDCLKDFKALSVREEAGAKIIKRLTGRDATVLIDPTMMLTKDEWRRVAQKPKGAEDGYILTYFLSPKCDAANEKLEEIRTGRVVYELLNKKDRVVGTAGPAEFVWLFDHADIILTDSFHACVFSFLFDKPFIVYDREFEGKSMNSRLETLLKTFSIERKYANSGLANDIWEHNYATGYEQLEIERDKAIKFLKKALEE